MEKASGRISIRIFSISSSSSFTSLSDSVANCSLRLTGISVSISAFISAILFSKGSSISLTFSLRATVRALNSSFVSLSISLYASNTCWSIGLICLISRSAFEPNIFLITSTNAILYLYYQSIRYTILQIYI